MKTLTYAAVSALALAAAGCHPKVHRAVTKLDCPAAEGSLSRLSVAPDGKSCTYKSASGAEIQLRLVPVVGSIEATLASLETEALALRGPAAVAAAKADADAVSADADAVEAQAQADAGPEPAAADDKEVADAAEAAEEEAEDVNIHMPGLQVTTRGDSAKINFGGVHIDASDEGGATVRNTRYVRLLGEAAAREKRGVRAFFIRASDGGDPLPSVGYQAAGPKAGPITVALVKWSSHDNDEINGDVRKLVRKNGGA